VSLTEEERGAAQDLLLALRVKQVLTAFTPVGDEDKALYAKAKAKAGASLRGAMATYVEGEP
jgi:hypothetical protein